MRCHHFRTIQIVLFLAALPQRCHAEVDCPNAYAALNDCLGYSGGPEGASECEYCVVGRVAEVNGVDLENNETLSCTQFNPDTCSALDYCSACAGCHQELVTYSECELGCSIEGDCASDGTAPSPTSSPTVLQCPDERAAFYECVEQNGVVNDCDSCRAGVVPDEGINSCEYSEQLTCSMMEECPICGDCQEVYTTLVNCLNTGCRAFDCASPTLAPSAAPSTANPTLYAEEEPTVPPNATLPDDDGTCAAQKDEFEDCMYGKLTVPQSASCRSCVEAKFDQLLGQEVTSTRCATVDTELCDAVSTTCECGECSDFYLQLVQCRVDEGESGCKVLCKGITSRATLRFGTWGVGSLLALPPALLLLLLVTL
jgi:hypothetical protein